MTYYPATSQAIDPRWAWERYRPDRENPWDVRKVGHLFRRTGFGANTAELDATLRDGPDWAIDMVFQGRPGQTEFERDTAPLAQSIREANGGLQATAWWLYRMLYTPHPLREKLTYFWH